MNTDYLIEKRLKNLSPKYHELIANSTFVLSNILENYKTFFSNYTDHSIVHSLNVLDFVNRLVGTENIHKLNEDELYILVMGAYLHDTGMGISEHDFNEACGKIIPSSYLESHLNEDVQDTIRKFHHELSSFFVYKYKDLFEIPSKKHVFGIAAASRGHRITNLYNADEFPPKLKMDNGNLVCIPYLSALIRLADEMDIAEDRIFSFDYPVANTIHKRVHHCIKRLEVTDDSLIYYVKCDEELLPNVTNVIDKLKVTFNDCKKAIEDLTPYKVKQNQVMMKRIN